MGTKDGVVVAFTTPTQQHGWTKILICVCFLLVLTYSPALSLNSYQGCHTFLLCNVCVCKRSVKKLFCCRTQERIVSVSIMKYFYFLFLLQVNPFIFLGRSCLHSMDALLMERPLKTTSKGNGLVIEKRINLFCPAKQFYLVNE